MNDRMRRAGSLVGAARGAIDRLVRGTLGFSARVYHKAGQADIFFLAGGIAFNILLGAIPFFLLLVAVFDFVLSLTVPDPQQALEWSIVDASNRFVFAETLWQATAPPISNVLTAAMSGYAPDTGATGLPSGAAAPSTPTVSV